jgi:hypothetical protein
VIVGIDNGISGGLVALSEMGPVVSMLPMPVKAAKKGNEIDPVGVWNWLKELGPRDKLVVVIEEPGGSKSASAAKSMSGSFHTLRTICELKGLSYHRITPQSWQKALLVECKAGDTKKAALLIAKLRWPDDSFLATKRSKVPHTGLVDAALIAEYWRRKSG